MGPSARGIACIALRKPNNHSKMQVLLSSTFYKEAQLLREARKVVHNDEPMNSPTSFLRTSLLTYRAIKVLCLANIWLVALYSSLSLFLLVGQDLPLTD